MELLTLKELNDKRISSTALKRAKKGTRDLLYYYVEEKERKGYFDFGNALELYLIDLEAFGKEVAIFDDDYHVHITLQFFEDEGKSCSKPRATKYYKDNKAKFDKENEGKYIIPSTGPDSMELITILTDLANAHPFSEQLGGDYQTTFEWTCPETKLKRMCRPDITKLKERTIIDIKTDAQGDFIRAAANNDHFLQAYDHIVGAKEDKGVEIEEYYWFVLTKCAPYYVDVYALDVENLLRVEESYWKTLRRIREDIDAGINIVWHEIPVMKITPPNWYK